MRSVAAVALVSVLSAFTGCRAEPSTSAAPIEARTADVAVATPGSVASRHDAFPRDLQPYAGLGAWVDVFNYAPQYQPEGRPPPITPVDLDEMHRRGVKTVFLQATRWDDQAPGGFADTALAASFLSRAHELGMRVVGWYLPRLVDPALDVIRAKQIVDFRSGDERFDGLAVDIEYTEGETDVAKRNDNLIWFSRTLREAVPDQPIAAIMLSAVHLEVVNENYWPAFPYDGIRDLYDVWMPMAYWTIRLAPYDDGYRFTKESVDRLRADLGKPDATVAPIGGIADEMTDESVAAYARALQDVGAIGGSLYNWNTMAPGKQALVQDLFARGPAAALPAAPLGPR